MTDEKEPSYNRFANFEGPTEDERTAALIRHRRIRGHGGESLRGGDMDQTTHRDWKHRPSWMK